MSYLKHLSQNISGMRIYMLLLLKFILSLKDRQVMSDKQNNIVITAAVRTAIGTDQILKECLKHTHSLLQHLIF